MGSRIIKTVCDDVGEKKQYSEVWMPVGKGSIARNVIQSVTSASEGCNPDAIYVCLNEAEYIPNTIELLKRIKGVHIIDSKTDLVDIARDMGIINSMSNIKLVSARLKVIKILCTNCVMKRDPVLKENMDSAVGILGDSEGKFVYSSNGAILTHSVLEEVLSIIHDSGREFRKYLGPTDNQGYCTAVWL